MDFFNERKPHGNVFNEIRTIQNRFIDLLISENFFFRCFFFYPKDMQNECIMKCSLSSFAYIAT
jgi:hypothetical protein